MLEQTLDFIREIDTLKAVERKTRPMSVDRRENSAEHSWHLAVMALLLAETADEPIDVDRVIRMLLVHDLPEVYANDVFVYDRTADDAARERAAAEKLFGILPEPGRGAIMALWEEFETGESAEARFARALDRFQPCFCNFHNKGGTWQEFGISPRAMLERNRPIADGSQALWRFVEDMVAIGRRRGYFPDEKDVIYG